MKRYALLLILGVALVVTACRTCRNQEVVQETYIHKYGVPVPKEDWSRNGRDGQIVTLKNDGVTVKKSYEKGILHGKTSYTFPNSSTLSLVEEYDQGALVSKTENYLSGVAKEQEKYLNSLIAERLRWYEDGTPATIERYENGLITSGEYRTPMNEIESKVSEGKGVRITRGNDGELLFKDTIEEGQMVERTAYFPNGEPSSITPYKDGKVHGNRLTFIQGGIPNTNEEWAHGVQDGLTTVYINGAKLSEIPYMQGKREGIERRYRDGEVLAEEVAWKNDKQHGERKILLDGGQSKSEWYNEGAMVSRATYERMNLVR